ncbi:MAG: EAL domain-containing protein [Oscillospiraceae bacterium]|nr:EAL domain-containing protein [Oscillospiraceae bacterium]
MDGLTIIAFSLAAVFAVAFFAVLFVFIRRRSKPDNGIDAMTGLLSRERFLKECAVQLKKNSDEGRRTAMVVFDVDGHGKISTLFGSEVGNGVVKGFAEAVKQVVNGKFRASRVDNDDFAVLFSYTRDAEIEAFVSDFREALNSIFSGTSVMEQVDFFAGIAVYDGIDDIYTLFNKANLCLIMNDGNRVTRFSEEMEKRMVEDEILRAEMVNALEEGQFELYYQPKISFRTGEITGVEALIRWHHPTKGFVPPNDFIPLAEQTGIITQIDEWGLRTACRQCKQWQNDGLPPVKISVNMSQAQFYRTDVISTVKNVLEETGLDPQWLEIEVTETMAMRDIERTINVLGRIRSMGVSISMDDFGSGYSSLSSLKTIPLDILKIDRSLVCDLDENDVSKQITGAIVNLGKAMKLIILAEGVETEEQCQFLTRIGCDLAQGYYYSKPRPAAEITALLLMPKEALLKQV